MRIIKFLIFAALFFVMLIAFLPKENIYYLLEEKLFGNGIILNEKSIRESFSGLDLEDIDVSFGGSEIAHTQKAEAFFGILYNKIELTSVIPANSMRNFIPTMSEISAWYTPFYPTKVFLNSSGDIGSISGSYNLYSKKIYLELQPSANSSRKYPMLNANFKNIDGRLVYELSFK
ncbi:MAG: hypothetical protein LBL65_03160 [Campylobacteraceae bacterium]|jgi:hypothetical protein|nr:hypothetical protein [Campylobacteraceae bacterium]